ncbi:tripartite tricarboxylate transporter permease [Pararhizobium haloflavum]|uniref:tripartite tricarboxylate transporter permease n=1 Tax=Pararhizobium haloflavum TaxID=2037914 RepID=UPI001300168D|nr:tripartite tricarboxylate transporter permease [Pararhizobium haloflavum]
MTLFEFDFLGLFSLSNLSGIAIGTFVGLLIGALPGLGATVAIVLLLPFTYSMEPLAAILMLVAAYQGAEYGGSISSIILGIPGTPAAAATLIDGNALAKRSSPGKALAYSLAASTVGGLFGGLVLLFMSVPLSVVALQLGDPEFFLIGILGLVAVAGLSSVDVLRSSISVVLGLMTATIGIDVISSAHRYTFGSPLLFDGLHLVAVLVGIFAFAEMFSMISTDLHRKYVTDRRGLSTRLNIAELRRVLRAMWIGSGIGSVIGFLPGMGAGASAWFAYSLARNTSRKPETFGTGNPEGIAAPEAANNATVGGAMLPVITLGIPGSASTAIIMSAFIIHGIQPGPTVFTANPALVNGIFYGFLVATLAMFVIGKLLTPFFARVLVVPNYILVPIVMILAMVGVYASSYVHVDLWVALIFGVAFFLLNKLDFSAPAFILAFVLSPILEESLRRALLISDGSYTMFITRGYSIAILAVITLVVVLGIASRLRRSSQETARPSAGS